MAILSEEIRLEALRLAVSNTPMAEDEGVKKRYALYVNLLQKSEDSAQRIDLVLENGQILKGIMRA